MFTGFASENTPAIQVWDFAESITTANTRIALADDCAPVQYFKTGGSTSLSVFLPNQTVEGRVIKFVNAKFASFNQNIFLYTADRRNGGTSGYAYSLGPGQTLDLCYSKNAISGSASTFGPTGWISLNQAASSAANIGASVFGVDTYASGAYSFATGLTNAASGAAAAVVGGSSNTASGINSVIVGGQLSSATTTQAAVFCGVSNVANATNSVVVGGGYSTTRSIIANFVSPASNAPISSGSGVQQTALLVLGRQTTDATATVLASNSSAAGTTNQVILPNNSAYTFQGTVIANVTGAGNTSAWKFEGAIKRGASAATTTLVAAVTPTVIAQDVGAVTWVLAITADTTNGGIAVTVTGAAATTIRWVCKIETTEVTF